MHDDHLKEQVQQEPTPVSNGRQSVPRGLAQACILGPVWLVHLDSSQVVLESVVPSVVLPQRPLKLPSLLLLGDQARSIDARLMNVDQSLTENAVILCQ